MLLCSLQVKACKPQSNTLQLPQRLGLVVPNFGMWLAKVRPVLMAKA